MREFTKFAIVPQWHSTSPFYLWYLGAADVKYILLSLHHFQNLSEWNSVPVPLVSMCCMWCDCLLPPGKVVIISSIPSIHNQSTDPKSLRNFFQDNIYKLDRVSYKIAWFDNHCIQFIKIMIPTSQKYVVRNAWFSKPIEIKMIGYK